MAVISSGAHASAQPLSPLDPWTAPLLPAPTSSPTRKRRNHGVFAFGSGVASVYSSRRASASDRAEGVSLVLMDGSSRMLSGGMTPTQARGMAQAILAAAEAFEALQTGGAT